MKKVGMLVMASIGLLVTVQSLACINYTVKNKTENKIFRVTFFLAPKKGSNEVVRVEPGDMKTLCGRRSSNLIVREKQSEDTVAVCNYAISNGVLDSMSRQFGTCPMVKVKHNIITLY